MDIVLSVVRLCCGQAGGPARGKTSWLSHLNVQLVYACVPVSNHARTKSHVSRNDVMCEYVYTGAANCAYP